MNITIGQGPDFVMRRGKVELFHTLKVTWYLNDKSNAKTELISDRSLRVLTNAFFGTLSKFESFSLNLTPVESDPLAFELYDGNKRVECSVSLNRSHRIPVNIRSDIRSIFIHSFI